MMLSNIMPTTESVPKPLIPIPPEVVPSPHADNPAAPWIPTDPEDTKSLKVSLPFKMLTTKELWPLPSKREDGLHTGVVSSPTVELNLITLSFLLDILALIG